MVKMNSVKYFSIKNVLTINIVVNNFTCSNIERIRERGIIRRHGFKSTRCNSKDFKNAAEMEFDNTMVLRLFEQNERLAWQADTRYVKLSASRA